MKQDEEIVSITVDPQNQEVRIRMHFVMVGMDYLQAERLRDQLNGALIRLSKPGEDYGRQDDHGNIDRHPCILDDSADISDA